MKITLLLDTAEGAGHTLVAGTVFELALRVTNDDGSAASNIPLQWATFRQAQPALKSRSTLTDDDGVAQNEITAFPQPDAKPEPVFVQTPDGKTHWIGSVHCRSDEAVIFAAASPGEAPPPLAPETITASNREISGEASYRLTIDYPGLNSILPPDTSQIVYARLLDDHGVGVPGATIEVATSTPQIDCLRVPVTTDAQGWATFWVRAVGLAEKAVDRLTGTVTAKCPQYRCSDTKPLTFDTTAGGPGYFSLSLSAVPTQAPRLARATYLLRDGTPGKYAYLGISARTPEGGYTNAAATSPSAAYADDSGTALSYLIATTQSTAKIIVCIDAGGGDFWASDPFEIVGGQYAQTPVYWIMPSMTAPLRTGFSQQLSMETDNKVSSSVTWTVEPRHAPVKLLPIDKMTEGKARAEMTGTSTSDAYKAYAAGIIGTYSQNGASHLCANAYSFYNGDVPPSRTLCGTVTMSFPDGALLSMKDWHSVDVVITRYDGSPWPNRVVNWNASIDPRSYKDSLFEVPYPSTTDSDGKCSIRIRADSTSNLMATITASSPNPLRTPDDVAQRTVVFDASIQPVGNAGVITITSQDAPPLTPYVAHPLTASYTDARGSHRFRSKKIIWSAFPSGQFEFSPNPSVTDDNGNTAVTITAVGDDYLGPVTVYARAYNESTELLDIGNLASLSFRQGTPPPNTAHIALRPVGGDLISDPLTHLVEATYRTNDGAPLADRLIHWTAEPPNSISLPSGPTTTTTTDENGMAVTAFVCRPGAFTIATLTASAINPDTGRADTASKMLVAVKNGRLVSAESRGYVTVAPTNRAPYREGIPTPLLATYHQHNGLPFPDTNLYWAAYPGARVEFTWPGPTETTSTGYAANSIVCSTGGNVSGVIVCASAPNYSTGSYDFGQTSMSFVDPTNQPGLQGSMIDKPYARNPPISTPKIDPRKADQVVTARIVLTGPDRAERNILISTDPEDAHIVVFDENNQQLNRQDSKFFVATTNAEGVATVKAGALNVQLVSLQAAYGKFSTPKTPLSIALIDDNVATTSLPEIQLKGGFDPMPPNTPFFQAFIEQGSVSGDERVAVILNDVVVYDGDASNFFAGVNVAYALLNTDTRSRNTISYLRLSGSTTSERKKLMFAASGTAQTSPIDPLTGPRKLQKPGVIASGPTIGPSDIVAGLGVMIPPYNDVALGDVITLFFYLSGKYALTGRPIHNIATLSYTVTAGDALTKGELLSLVLPQFYVAGYSTGTVLIEYKVSSSSGRKRLQWSQVAGPIDIDTTL